MTSQGRGIAPENISIRNRMSTGQIRGRTSKSKPNERNVVDQFLDLLNIKDAHPRSRKFYELLIDSALLHARKQADYGSDQDPFANITASNEFGVPSWKGALIRMNDKVTRLKTFSKKNSLANESAEDSMRDIAVYALIAYVLYEEESE